jgi:hypothetical protein
MRDISGANLNRSWKIRTIQPKEWRANHQGTRLLSGKACGRRPEYTPPDVAMITLITMECLIAWT